VHIPTQWCDLFLRQLNLNFYKDQLHANFS
jgi:hypothetical protein